MRLFRRAAEIYSNEGLSSLLTSSREFIAWRSRQLVRNTHRSVYSRYQNYNYVDIMDADWDTLIILDGCRYDLFRESNQLSGTLEKRHSKGSSTPEFLRKNVTDRYGDTVYVTANPQHVVHDLEGEFHKIVDVWETNWNSELGTVHPQAVTEQAIETHQNYPRKRLLVHYMQPHYPFIGPTGQQLPTTSKFETHRREAQGENEDVAGVDDIWTLLEYGEVSKQKVVSAYKENLELTFPHIQTLLDNIDGKTVVTSDHGNLYGERIFPFFSKKYGHPTSIHARNLVEIPWLIVESGSRRCITSDNQKQESSAEETKEVRDRLRDLGYVDP